MEMLGGTLAEVESTIRIPCRGGIAIGAKARTKPGREKVIGKSGLSHGEMAGMTVHIGSTMRIGMQMIMVMTRQMIVRICMHVATRWQTVSGTVHHSPGHSQGRDVRMTSLMTTKANAAQRSFQSKTMTFQSIALRQMKTRTDGTGDGTLLAIQDPGQDPEMHDRGMASGAGTNNRNRGQSLLAMGIAMSALMPIPTMNSMQKHRDRANA
mmetsp:Transcript_115009/g.210578  ORF Transcript_115009/g.210578 Transcript_115009/m.210578 type:complete len:210 (+) Transcript_115009:214-843(+)